MKYNIPRVMLSAGSSGSGKTTLTLGVLSALMQKKVNLCAFKCGPDYIDPMFHSKVIGAKCRNLDTFLMGEENTKFSLYNNSKNSEISIIEGVMGYYDGLLGKSDIHSTYHIAKVTKTPTIIVINGKGAAYTTIALLKGLIDFRADSNIKGVIFNNITAMTYKFLHDLVVNELNIKPLGYIEHNSEFSLESRHLGLITASEVDKLAEMTQKLGENISKTVDLDGLIEIAKTAIEFEVNTPSITKQFKDLTIGIALDKAFCFYYQDNLDLLEQLGANLQFFSPLEDKELPKNLDGLIIGGGYPELYLEKIAQNKSMLNSIKMSLENNLPCLAECGGFMYLGESIQGNDGEYHQTVNFLQGNSHKKEKLQRFGYFTLTANIENFMLLKGENINCHEFHYWDSDNCGDNFTAQKPTTQRQHNCIICKNNVIAGYPHIHFYGNTSFPINFLKKCEDFHNGNIK